MKFFIVNFKYYSGMENKQRTQPERDTRFVSKTVKRLDGLYKKRKVLRRRRKGQRRGSERIEIKIIEKQETP